jgi:Ca2+-binding RTX toxin-like protein
MVAGVQGSILCGGGMTAFTGTTGNNKFTGTSDDDSFDLSQGGNDTANGLGGNDTFNIGAALNAADRIDGGEGDDTVTLNGDYNLVFAAKTMVNVEEIDLVKGHDYRLTLNDANVAASDGFGLEVDGTALGKADTLVFDGSAETDSSLLLRGGAGGNTLTGGALGDSIYAGVGRDHLNGGGGDDALWKYATNGAVAMDGGTGDDTAYIDREYDTADLTLSVAAHPTGTSKLVGDGAALTSVENIWLYTGSGNDTITFLSNGTASFDGNHIDCGNGNDVITTGAGSDTLYGGEGDDRLGGGAGDDQLYGSKDSGNIYLFWPTYHEFGGPGDDVLTGGAGNDFISDYTGFGDLGGHDTMNGGSGNDTLVSYSGVDKLDGGAGSNALQFDRRDATANLTIVITDPAQVVTVGGNGSTLIHFQTFQLRGGSGNDRFTTLGGEDYLDGGTGSNVLKSGAGDDTVVDRGTNSTLDGGKGSDILTLDRGSLTTAVAFAFDGRSSTAVSLQDGTAFKNFETLELTTGSGNDDVTFRDLAGTFQNYWHAGAGNDHVTVDLSSGVNAASLDASSAGFAIANSDAGEVWLYDVERYTIIGGAGNDGFTGGAFADSLRGGAGDDSLVGGKGNDILDGGDGFDTVSYADAIAGVTVDLSIAGAQAVGGGLGRDTLSGIESVAGSSFDDVLTGSSSGSTLDGGDGNDILAVSGGDNTVDGGGGDDVLRYSGGSVSFSGGDGFDTVSTVFFTGVSTSWSLGGGIEAFKGGAAADHVEVFNDLFTDRQWSGGGGDDDLSGAWGDDVLNGGRGADHLDGDAGSDRFVYAAAADSTSTLYDTITGFSISDDTIDVPGAVTGIDALVSSGKLSTAHFDAQLKAAVGAAQLAAHHAVVFVPDSGTLADNVFLVVDMNGVAGYQSGKDLVIHLDGGDDSLTIGNFV